jgi:hypothetical protein
VTGVPPRWLPIAVVAAVAAGILLAVWLAMPRSA